MFTPPAPVFRGTGHPLAWNAISWPLEGSGCVILFPGISVHISIVWVSLAKRIHAKPRDMGNIAWSKSAFRHHAQA